jgi:hypothetical protein
MAVEFTVDAFSAERFAGTVKQVRYSPTTVQNVVTYAIAGQAPAAGAQPPPQQQRGGNRARAGRFL